MLRKPVLTDFRDDMYIVTLLSPVFSSHIMQRSNNVMIQIIIIYAAYVAPINSTASIQFNPSLSCMPAPLNLSHSI